MNAVELIIRWIADKPAWWKLAIKVALRESTLSNEHIQLIYSVAQSECGLIPKHPNHESFSSPIDITGFTPEEYPVKLKSLHNVEGVALLGENQNLNFETKGLTIVYGDNGAGKSSYASILKHACLTRGTLTPITGNVFSNVNKPPKASLTVSRDSSSEDILWSPSSLSNNDAKSIRVFDTSSAHHYLSNEDTLGYKPVGLSLITELTKAVEGIKNIITEEVMGGNGFVSIPSLASASQASIFLNQLSASSTLKQLEMHCATQEEIDSINTLETELISYKAQSPMQIKHNLQRRKEIIAPLLTFFDTPLSLLNGDKFNDLKELEADYILKKTVVDKLRTQTLSNLPFDNVGNAEWKQLWDSAKAFIQKDSKILTFPPAVNDSCPLCLQDIGIDSATKLQSFEDFIQNKVAKSASDAFDTLTKAKSALQLLNLDDTQYLVALNEVDTIHNGIKKSLQELIGKLAIRRSHFLLENLPATIEKINLSVFTKLKEVSKKLEEQIEEITTSDTHSNFIATQEAKIVELKDRKYISLHKANILTNINRHITVDKLTEIKSQCNTRSISTISSKIYSDGVIEPLKDSFQAELDSFGFNRFTVKVCTRNKAGNQQFKLQLEDSGEAVVSKVASEGEQRCIAIASFLAEMKADARESAVIFDDPVNSLSHQWSARVADRLAKESLSRQVIIFTHDIVFYKLLLESSERISQTQIGYISLERTRTSAGIVKTNPPWDALTTSKRIGVLNTKLQHLRQLDSNGSETEFRDATRPFYSLLREAWERLVEEKLLNKVVNRFERGIQMQRLSRLDDITKADFELIDLAYGKCCNTFEGHDTATGMGHPYPTIGEVGADLDTLKSYLQQLQNDRKRT